MEVVHVAELNMEVVHLSSLEDNKYMEVMQMDITLFVKIRKRRRQKAVGPIILSQNGYGRKKKMEIRYEILVS